MFSVSRRRVVLTASVALLSLLASIASAGNIKPDVKQLDLYFDALEQNQRWQGSVALLVDGKLAYQRDLTLAQSGDTSPTYRVGSISKSLVSTLVMQQVEAGNLSLDATLDSWYPKIRNADKITITQLLNHRSGIANYTDQATYLQQSKSATSHQQMLDLFQSLASEFEPGSEHRYSNTNYYLLALVLEKVSGSAYADLIQSNIVKPGKLEQLQASGPTTPSLIWSDRWQEMPITDASWTFGAGDITASARDIAHFYHSLLNAKLLSQASIEAMKPVEDNYGFGLISIPYNDRIGFGHGGRIDNFNASAAYFPDGAVTITVLENGSRSIINNDVVIAMLAAAYGDPIQIPQFATEEEIANASALIDRYTGLYTSDEFPLDLTLFIENRQLFGQATGQGPFPLTPMSDTDFEFPAAGIVIRFSENALLLEQGPIKVNFERKSD